MREVALTFVGGGSAWSRPFLREAIDEERRKASCRQTSPYVRCKGSERSGDEGFWQKLDRITWQLFQGRKEDIWQPDTRPEAIRYAPIDKETSSLSFSQVYARALLGADSSRDPDRNQLDVDRGGTAVETATVSYSEREKLEELCDAGEMDACRVLTESNEGKSETWANRVQEVADFSEVPEDQEERVLTGRQLAEYCYAKYGFYHDMVILQAKPFGNDKRQVAFNIYGAYLGDIRTFKMTEDQYIARLDRVADMLNAWDQAWFVRQFFRTKIAPRRGLPSRPQADTAVTIRLNTSPTWKYLQNSDLERFHRAHAFRYMDNLR